MKSIDFIKTRKQNWINLEENIKKLKSIKSSSKNESLLMSFMHNYRKTIADLSLARSLFPKSELVHELNLLIIRAMSIISSNQKSDLSRIVNFFQIKIPELVIKLKNLFFVSLMIFSISTLAGYGLTELNPYTANAIVGDQYIYKTLENIEKGDPFAVYESRFKYSMSSYIMANNIKVSFMAFAMGALYGVGTISILFFNGLMLGSITAVFAKHDLLYDFITTVLIHGTLELFAIIVAGAAGLRLGQALFRPGDKKRVDAIYEFGREAFYLCITMVPVFIIAGTLEGFVTHMKLPVMQRILIIIGSLLFLMIYLIFPTWNYLRRQVSKEDKYSPDIKMKL